jgi:K+/H+ antiporter YhaU regulatory subunit KhtT
MEPDPYAGIGQSMFALITVLGVLAVSLLVTRVATMVLAGTGMSRANARFQARSALSGVGFTTSAAEAAVRHPVRRRVIFTLMLFGSGGLVTALASLVISFGGNAHNRGTRALVLIGALLVLWALSRSRLVDRWLTRAIARVLGARGWASRDYATVARLAAGHAVGELHVPSGAELDGATAAALPLGDGIAVLGVERRDGSYVSLPAGDTELRHGDTLLLYGDAERLERLAARPLSADPASR